MCETWKDIPGFGGHYQASTNGEIRSKDRIVTKPHSLSGKPIKQFYKSKILKFHTDSLGYKRLHIGFDGIKVTVSAHRLVLYAFSGPQPDGMEGCHNNGDPGDNRPDNLRWDTHYNNNQDRRNQGNYATCEKHPMAKFTRELVEGIRDRSVNYKDALSIHGISHSQYYRILRNESWVAA